MCLLRKLSTAEFCKAQFWARCFFVKYKQFSDQLARSQVTISVGDTMTKFTFKLPDAYFCLWQSGLLEELDIPSKIC